MITNYTGIDGNGCLSTLILDLINQMEEHLNEMDYIINIKCRNDNESDFVNSFIQLLNDNVKLYNNAFNY